MKKDNIAKIAIFLILITCLTGVVSASEDATNHTVAASDDTTVDKVVSDADTNDAPTTTTVDKNLKSVDDSDKSPVIQDKKQVDDIDDSTLNDEQSPESPRTTPQTYDINTTNYSTYIGDWGLNGNAGDTYNFVNNFTGKTIYIDKDNTTITSVSGVVLTNCGFSINQNIHGVTIKDLIIRNTISSYPIYVGPNCSDISITNNNILVNYTSTSPSYLYGIDFNAWSSTAYNFHNINITDNTIRMYGNSYVCGIYGSDFIDSNVLRNTIYVYSDTGSNSAGNNAVYGIALCDDSEWANITRPQNNKIAFNTITAIGQSTYAIEDFGINQDISDNTITVTANTTGSAYGIALGRIDNATVNTNNIHLTAGDLTQIITTDMIRGSNAGIRLHSNSTWDYYCNNVNINYCTIYYNTLISESYYSGSVQNDPGNTNININGVKSDTYYDPNPYDPIYLNNAPENRVLKTNSKSMLRASETDILRDSNVIYVDPVNGDDNNDGSSNSTAFKTITKALNQVISGGTIILNGGTYNLGYTQLTKSVSIKGTNREKTIIDFSKPVPFEVKFQEDGNFFLNFSNLTIKNGKLTLSGGDNAVVISNLINVTFEKHPISISLSKAGSYMNIINCSFNNQNDLCISFKGSTNTYSVNINSSSFYNTQANYLFWADIGGNPISMNYCSFINYKSIVRTGNNENITFNNCYFGMNDNPSNLANYDIDNWVVMSFENTTEIRHATGDANFLLSLKKLAHTDGTFTELEHPELLTLPSYNVTYTLTNGTNVTSTLKNLEDATTLPLTGYGTIKATAAGQTLGITIGHDITLNIKKDGDIGYGGEQNLVFISNYNNITGNMTVTITGNNSYSKEETLDIYGGRSFLTLKGLNAGDYTVNVKYSGDDVYYPQTNSTTFKVLKVESDDITLTAYANNITFTETADILVFVNPKGATGNVTITIDGNDTTEKLDKNGLASFHIKDLPVQNYTITVKYNGDTNFETATTTTKLTVNPNTIIEYLKQEIETLNNTLNTTKGQLDNATKEIETLNNTVQTQNKEIKDQKETITKQNNTIQTQTQEIKDANNKVAIAQEQARTANNNANAKISKIKAASKVKKSKNFKVTVTLSQKINGKYVYIIFNGKSYKAKAKNGVAKITIKKSALKKLGGKTIKYQIVYDQSIKNKSVKVKK